MGSYQDQDFLPPIEKVAPGYSLLERPISKLSIASLIFGILGVTALPFVGSVVAIILGHAAMGQIRDSRGQLEGKVVARLGLGLGYFFVVLCVIAAVIVAVVLALMVPPFFGAINANQAQIQEAAIAISADADRGVKMVNQMDHADFERLSSRHLEPPVNEAEIIAWYNLGRASSDPEFALLTTQTLYYVRGERTTAFALKDVLSLKDDAAYKQAYPVNVPEATGSLTADPAAYHIEVESSRGPRMHMTITPGEGGVTFFDALQSAVKKARDGETTR